jgi:hypothetical protein
VDRACLPNRAQAVLLCLEGPGLFSQTLWFLKYLLDNNNNNNNNKNKNKNNNNNNNNKPIFHMGATPVFSAASSQTQKGGIGRSA